MFPSEKSHDDVSAPPPTAETPGAEAISEIREYFGGKTVFVTGATGFLGKVLVEKLLRSCDDVRKIYILVREKKGKEPQQRFDEIFNVAAYEPLASRQPRFTDKMALCIGDCALPDLGLCQKDRDALRAEVDCVIHCAATVRFDAGLRKATHINVRAVRDLLKLAREMEHLTSFVHVSTAYSHCPRRDVDETFYAPLITGSKLIDLVETLDDDVLDAVTPTLLGAWPNTYAFTKAVAEEVIEMEGRGLPVAVVRPAIVIASYREPVPGWIDNVYGPTGVLMAAALGLLRTLHCDAKKTADIVPADYVVNALIAAAWNVGRGWREETDAASKVPTVYNYVSSCQNPIDWATYMDLTHKHASKVPSPLVVWNYLLWLNSSKLAHLVCVFLMHTVPAHVVDFFARCVGKKPMLVDAYRRIGKFSDVISYFCTREWNFRNRNVQNLWAGMGPADRRLFDFDVGRMRWDDYFQEYVKGARVYLLKDPLETIPRGRRKVFLLKVAHYALVTALCVALYKALRLLIALLV